MSAATLVARYEQLRDDVQAGMALTARRWGLHLLLARGLTAWMHAWAAMDSAAPENDAAANARRDSPHSSCGTDAGGSSVRTVPQTDTAAAPPPVQFQQQMTSLVVDLILKRSPIPA
jgi:hypothetical protein